MMDALRAGGNAAMGLAARGAHRPWIGTPTTTLLYVLKTL
jgi:hypothetical protein